MTSHKTKDSFCIRPFTHADIVTSGKIRVCCEIKPELTKFKGQSKFNVKDGFNKFWTSDYRQYLMQSFLQNKKPKECQECWQRESKNLESQRISGNRKMKYLFKANHEAHLKKLNLWNITSPQDMTFAITNLCNLKCQMCKGMFSSTLLSENKKLGFETNISQKDFDWDKGTKINFIENVIQHDLENMTILGGEPFIVPEIYKILQALSKKPKITERLDLTLFTNGTTCNKKMLDTLKKFKKLQLIISMDSTYKNSDYMRYPSNWLNIKKNIDTFKKMPFVKLSINATVQNLNIFYIDNLIEYAYKNQLHLNLSPISEPTYLQFNNLPLSILEKSLEKLTNIKIEKTIHVTNYKDIVEELKRLVDKKQQPDHIQFRKFTSMIRARDQYRKISIKNYMPELAKEILR